jgi:SAM-dependent methyltransferase
MAAMESRVSRDGEVASRWEEYHARAVGREPRPLLLRACELLGPGEGRVAVDLGCGSGAETLALASRGWAVTAVDQDLVALALLRGQARGSDLVKIVHASFTEAELPQAHLVHAGYSLPFCAPGEFRGFGPAVALGEGPGPVPVEG